MLWRFIELGGPIMWPLLACSVLLTAFLVERLWIVVVRHRLMHGRVRPDMLRLHKRLLPFFADVPPSLGLFGTVVGVVQSFQLVNGRLDGEAVGAGLGIACITTIFGLGIAIVATVSRYLFDWLVGPDPAAQRTPQP